MNVEILSGGLDGVVAEHFFDVPFPSDDMWGASGLDLSDFPNSEEVPLADDVIAKGGIGSFGQSISEDVNAPGSISTLRIKLLNFRGRYIHL